MWASSAGSCMCPSSTPNTCIETICAIGAEFGLLHVGHFCVDACRIEKGYRHWGHDIGPEDSPLEAGLGFAVGFEKEIDFVGRSALLAQRARGLSRHLLLFSVEDASPLLLHDEPVYSSGRLVGRTTSGARGFRTDCRCALHTSAAPQVPRRLACSEHVTRSVLRASATACVRWRPCPTTPGAKGCSDDPARTMLEHGP